MAYYCKSVKLAGWKSAETKTALLVSIVSSLLILTLCFGFKGVFAFDFDVVSKLQQNHLAAIFIDSSPKNLSINADILQIGCAFLNAIVIFSVFPTIIRFSTCYASNLRRTLDAKARIHEEQESDA